MALDVDYIAARNAIEEISKVLGDVPHGERVAIADEIIDFAQKLKLSYGKKTNYGI
jgi:hypothetical protein